MSPQDRQLVEAALREVDAVMTRNGMVSGGQWTFDAELPDGRSVRRKFKLEGYVRAARPVATHS